ncbi:MAG: RNA polymerase sigma factor [Planctomycetaceae bacterium]
MPDDTNDRYGDHTVRKWNVAELTDTELMNELNTSRCQDDRPLRVLRVRHEGLVLNILRSQDVRGSDAEDVAAHVWWKVARLARQGRWNPAKAVHTQDPFVPLLKKITSNLGRDFWRQENTRKKQFKRLEQHVRLFGADWRDAAAPTSREWKAVRPVPSGVPDSLAAVVAELPDDLRLAYELHAQGLGCRDIGERVGCSAATANRRVNRAKKVIASTVRNPRSSVR